MLPLWFRANSFAFRSSRCGFARIPLIFDAPAMVSSNSGLTWPLQASSGGPLRLPAVACRCGGVLWFRANSVVFRCSRCGFARIPASRGLLRPLLGGPLIATAHAVGRGLRFDAPAVVSRDFRPLLGGPLRLPPQRRTWGGPFDAPALVSCEFRCVSMLPLWFRANSGLSWPLQGGGHLGCRPPRRTRWGGPFVSTLPLWCRADSVAFRRSLCCFARIPASRGLFRPLQGGAT